MQPTDRRAFLLSTLSLATGGALLAGTAPAHAQAKNNWPDKPLRIVVPGPPGGGTDLLGRSLAIGMPKALGQPVIVDNSPVPRASWRPSRCSRRRPTATRSTWASPR